eukprot:1709749-Amphidinium_carterae.1
MGHMQLSPDDSPAVLAIHFSTARAKACKNMTGASDEPIKEPCSRCMSRHPSMHDKCNKPARTRVNMMGTSCSRNNSFAACSSHS